MIMVTLQDPDSGEKVRIPMADDYPGNDGWTVIAEDEWPTLDMLKEASRDAVLAKRAALEHGTAQTPVGTVAIDDSSKLKIDGALSLCRLSEEQQKPFALKYTLADGSRVELDNTGMRQLAGAVGAYVAALYDHAAGLAAAIEAATSAEDIDAIDLEAGWP